MPFYRYEPADLLRKLIGCYWITEEENPGTVSNMYNTNKVEGIIPD